MAPRRALLSLALLGLARAAWLQRGGDFMRRNFWVEAFSDAKGSSEGSAASAAASAGAAAAPAPPRTASAGAAVPATYPIPALYNRQATKGFQLMKTPGAVVTSSGLVAYATADCQLTLLTSPDDPGAWSDGGFIVEDDAHQEKSTIFAACHDLAIDASDNLYLLRKNDSGQAFVHGWYAYSAQNGPDSFTEFLLDANGTGAKGIFVGGDLRVLELFSVGMTHVPDAQSGALLGDVWVPMTGLDGTCVASVDLDSTPPGAVKRYSCGDFRLGGATGGVGLRVNPLGPNLNSAIFTNNGELGLPTTFMTARSPDGSTVWQSDVVGVADLYQAPPLGDDETGRIFAVEHMVGAPMMRIHCVDARSKNGGHPCTGWPAAGSVVQDVFKVPGGGSYNVSFVYGGAAFYSADYSIMRIVYSLTLVIDLTSEPFPLEPVGCLVGIDPTTGAEVDSYCIPRDEASFYANVNYLATAPIVARNARGPGLHSVYVAQADMVVLAFDPLNLKAGELFRVKGVSKRNGNNGGVNLAVNATVASDYMSMTGAGTLLIPYWENAEAGKDGYGVVAIPNINAFVAPSPSPTPAPAASTAGASTPLSPGGAAGISITVLLLVAAGAFVAVSGGVAPAMQRVGLAPGPGGARATFLGGSSGAGKYSFVGGAGSYGSVGSASGASQL